MEKHKLKKNHEVNISLILVNKFNLIKNIFFLKKLNLIKHNK
jgi:hypothetical protein